MTERFCFVLIRLLALNQSAANFVFLTKSDFHFLPHKLLEKNTALPCVAAALY